MNTLRKIAKKIPILSSIYRIVKNRYEFFQLKSQPPEAVFTNIYNNNRWGGTESVSGLGSDIHQTELIIQELPSLFKEYQVESMLDIPCGDFHWMKNMDLSNIEYIGADIVDALIERNTQQYGNGGNRFQKINLINDSLPEVDLLFCRDCLVHLSFKDIWDALYNICASNSEYLLTTTFPGRDNNDDIATGQWRTLNLELSPFMLPKPLKLINEGCTEYEGAFADKALGLWKISEIQESLPKKSI